APVRNRVVAIANEIGRELAITQYDSRGGVLDRYARRYGIDVYLVDPQGEPLAARPVKIPIELLQRLRMGAPPNAAEDLGGGRHPEERGEQGRAATRRMGIAPPEKKGRDLLN